MKYLLILCYVIFSTNSQNLFYYSNHQFTTDIYKELHKYHIGNVVFSPLSAESLLVLLHAGADGQTSRQLASLLNLPDDKQTMTDIFKDVLPYLHGSDNLLIHNANTLYVGAGLHINQEFRALARSFDTDLQNMNFYNKNAAANEINRWVAERTLRRIQEAVKPSDLEGISNSVLINALTFHGNWAKAFNKQLTYKRPFHLDRRSEIKVDMMERYTHFKYYESWDLQAKFLEIPYADDGVTMTFVLPNYVEGISRLEERIDDVIVSPSYGPEEAVFTIIPKFTVDSILHLDWIIKNKGAMFMDNYGDFQGIINERYLTIDKFIQKVKFEIREDGASPATLYYAPHGTITKEFIADHPFLFYVKMRDVILFIGKVDFFD